jgi:hypothetical protein
MKQYEITLKEYNANSTVVIYRSIKTNEQSAADQLLKFMREKYNLPESGN